ncbi:MAG: hypothetical protein E6G40_13585 [Actinobacteria bacterium]|nr:MAG: hypothetical protein E6G40_13585 [Actinomycetota bacterium]
MGRAVGSPDRGAGARGRPGCRCLRRGSVGKGEGNRCVDRRHRGSPPHAPTPDGGAVQGERVLEKAAGRVDEVLLVLDATTGQNGIAQARAFTESVGVTGLVLAKMDGTARGGIVLAVRDELRVPVKLVGTGEGVRDLVPFDPESFARRLVA